MALSALKVILTELKSILLLKNKNPILPSICSHWGLKDKNPIYHAWSMASFCRLKNWEIAIKKLTQKNQMKGHSF
jgi:hypothetical protein